MSKKVQLVDDDTDQASPSGANAEGSGPMGMPFDLILLAWSLKSANTKQIL